VNCAKKRGKPFNVKDVVGSFVRIAEIRKECFAEIA